MKTKHIAIVSRTKPLAEAIKERLKDKKGFTFSVIESISDRPAGSIVASLGLPPYIPGGDSVNVIAFNSKNNKDATAEEKSAQWTTLRSKDAPIEDILEELGNYSEYCIMGGNAVKDAKLAVAEIKSEIASCETPEEQAEAYKSGMNTLLQLLG